MNIRDHFAKDKALFNAMMSMPEIKLSKRKNVFLQLVRSVAGQQLSTKAAASIFAKFIDTIPSCTPQGILSTNIETLRGVGFSYGKANYIQNIASFWEEKKISDATFSKMKDEDIIAMLTQIKGVGAWTVQMLLMFTLARPNVFSIDDLGIQQGMQALYKWPAMDKKTLKEKMIKKAATYEPYSTYACLYIWRWKDEFKKNIATEKK